MARWYRAYEGTTTDPKLGEVALIAECSRSVVIATWHAILEACAGANAGGAFDLTPRRVAVSLGEPISLIQAVFSGLAEVGMIEGDQVVRWKDRQYESDSSTSRVRAFRERKRVSETFPGSHSAVSETPRNSEETFQQRCVTAPETETETDTEITSPYGEEVVALSPAPRFDLNEASDAWNALADRKGLARIQRMSEPRRRALKARLAECGGLEGWHAALEKVEASPFLVGQNDRGWRADFDFVVKEANFIKIMEGKYDQRADQKSAAKRAFESLFAEEDAGDAHSPFQPLQVRTV